MSAGKHGPGWASRQKQTSPRIPVRRPDHSERQKQMSTDNKTKELSMMDCTHAFAEPGAGHIVDVINPFTCPL